MPSESTILLNPTPAHPHNIKRFSDFKSRIATESTAERPSHQSKTYGSHTKNSDISEFQMEDPDKCEIETHDNFVLDRKEEKTLCLTFASIKLKNSLIKRVESFMSSIGDMIQSLLDKKEKRKLILHNQILEDCKRESDKISCLKTKVTFQLIGKILREDCLLTELNEQYERLLEVEGEIRIMYFLAIKMKGGFCEFETKDLVSRVCRIEEFCEYLCERVNEYEKTFDFESM